MQTRKLILVNTLFIFVGLLVAASWVRLISSKQILAELSEINPLFIIPLVAVTLFFVFVRFIRWQFLMRKVGYRLPTRNSLSIYLASLLGTATPAYVGEFFIRSFLINRSYRIPFRATLLVMVFDRMLDFTALGIICLITSRTWWGWALGGIFGIFGMGFIFLGSLALSRFDTPIKIRFDPNSLKIFLSAILLSLVAWIPASFLTYLASASLGVWISPLSSMNGFSTATLLGGLSLSPAGIGVTGSVLIYFLEQLSGNVLSSILAVTIIRVTSTLLILLIGLVFFIREFLKLTTQAKIPIASQEKHFDRIADDYNAQFTEHIWSHLLIRKSRMLQESLLASGIPNGQGLDLGCGLGLQILEMVKYGYSIVGVDLALNLLHHARKNGASVIQADGICLPFSDNSLDFVYSIGVLHHLPGAEAQRKVTVEISRILKPNGVFIVHETNTHNPFFRLYMGYIFPVLRKIDEGTECWIEPAEWGKSKTYQLVDIQYFTFIPDFLPKACMKAFLKLENMLENSRLRPFSVHYMAVMKKSMTSSE